MGTGINFLNDFINFRLKMNEQNLKEAREVEGEVWKDVKGYEGHYQVSNLGRIKSFKRKEPRIFSRKLGAERRHLVISLLKNGLKLQKLIHRIVLETFIGPCPENMEACHNDGNPLNNKLNNLRWDTHKNNELDRIRHGTWGEGEKHSRAKLKQYAVDFIRAAFLDGMSLKTLAAIFNVREDHISTICNERAWRKEKKCCELARAEQALVSRAEAKKEDYKICKKLEQHGPCGQDIYTGIRRTAVNNILKEAQQNILNSQQ